MDSELETDFEVFETAPEEEFNPDAEEASAPAV
jgi:hypothetical protein